MGDKRVNMVRKIVRGWENIAEISSQFPVVIYGVGDVGRRLLQEIRVNDVKNVFIYDENEEKTSDLVERIELEEMKRKSSILVFVITVANKVVAEEIEERILALNEEAHIYKYIQKDKLF